MIEMTLAEVAAAVGGTAHDTDPAVPVTGPVEFDSRKVTPGGLFVAFPGSTVDGHEFAGEAVAAGAVAVLGSRALPGIPTIVVDDVLAAMGLLARAVLDRLPDLVVIGLTGSSGKTTTKDLVAQVATGVGPTVASAGSFNNELGHPYTVLRADESTRFLVLEMGARGIGHIRYLCGIAPPRIGVVLNVGVAHLGEFGSVDAIARAKGELVEALPPDGVAVLTADDPRVSAMGPLTKARVVLVGETPDATLRADEVTLDELGRPAYTLHTPSFSGRVRLALSGRHQVGNSLAAAAVGRELGLADDELPDVLAGLRSLSSRRMDVFERSDGVTVIDDSYNANPASTAAALHTLAAVGRERSTVAVLGYLAELGDYERDGHEEVGQLAAQMGVDRLIVVGQRASSILDGAATVATWGGESVLATDQAAAVVALFEGLRPGDVVLVKGSRYRTWEVADALREAEVIAP